MRAVRAVLVDSVDDDEGSVSMERFKALVTVVKGHEDLAERWFSDHDVTVEAESVGDRTFAWYVVTGHGAVLEALQRTRLFVHVEHRVEEWPMNGDVTDPVLRARG